MNKNLKNSKTITLGQKVSDKVTATIGSWRFIIIQSIVIFFWIILNVIFELWDKYPFILLNLAMSFQAAYTAPIIMMSQNREAQRDRQRAEADYKINLLAENEIETIMTALKELDKKVLRHEEIKSEIAQMKAEFKALQDILSIKKS
ncbi:MAG: DUF1003 domain-containing protein [Flammeovirgaceae bacterium]